MNTNQFLSIIDLLIPHTSICRSDGCELHVTYCAGLSLIREDRGYKEDWLPIETKGCMYSDPADSDLCVTAKISGNLARLTFISLGGDPRVSGRQTFPKLAI